MSKIKEKSENNLVFTRAEYEDKVATEVSNKDIIIDEVDFNEFLEMNRNSEKIIDQLNQLCGTIYRLKKDQESYYVHEKTLNNQIDIKRKELVKRYKLDEQRLWAIDISTHKVVYK